MGIRFDSRAAYKDLEAAFGAQIPRLTTVVLSQAQSSAGDEDVRASLESFIDYTLPGVFEGVVFADHWKAWMEEWGKGSLMDQSNPDLYGYIGGDYWNKARNDFAIRGRPPGQYLGLDGKEHVSSGRAYNPSTGKGRNLEKLAESGKIKNNPQSYLPKPPTHFLRDALRANQRRILETFQETLNLWIANRFHLFLLTDGE